MNNNGIGAIQTKYGNFAIDELRDKKMAVALRGKDYPNEWLLQIARAFTTKESVVVDVGAHIGTFTLPASSFVKKVIAFEPSSESFAILSKNTAQSNSVIEIKNLALGKSAGTGSLVVRAETNAGANTLSQGSDFNISTLDAEVPHADFIKIDVEGMELQVLSGAKKLIEHSRPVVVFEVNLYQLRMYGASLRALEKFFTQRGYGLYYQIPGASLTFATVRSITFLTALLAPRAFLFWSDSAPFDIIAVPKEHKMECKVRGWFSVMSYAIINNLRIKIRRLLNYAAKK